LENDASIVYFDILVEKESGAADRLPGRIAWNLTAPHGARYGVPKAEIDRWSDERRAQYAKGGASIASNDNLKTDL
jgi:hypothetical protein